MTPPRPNKRRKIETQIATFLDIEAGVEADGDVSEEEEEYDQGFIDVDEDADSDGNIFSHTLLSREYNGAGDIDWDTFLDRARRRGRDGVPNMNAEGAREGPRDSDGLYEIMCQVGTEELAVFRVLQAAVDPAVVIYSAFARKSLPGRIFAEVPSLDAAQALTKKISCLSPHNIRPVPHERMTEMLELGGKLRLREQMWVRIKTTQGRYKRYIGDLALVVKVERSGKVELWLVPRLGPAVESKRPSQLLFDGTQADLDTTSVHPISEGHAVFLYRRERYSQQGYLVVSGFPDALIGSREVIPSTTEFTLFRGCEALDQRTRQCTEDAVLWNNLRLGDRVKVNNGCLQGLCGKIHEISGDEVHLYFASLDVSEVVLRMDLRKDYRPGDQVMVTSGDQKGMKGWVVEVLEGRAVVFDLDKLQQVEVLFLHLEFYEEWDSVCLRSLSDVSKPENKDDLKMKHDPNRKFIGKEVMIVGANHFKACRGVIRDTTWDGEASVELALFNHPRQEKFHLSHLRLVRENSLCEIQTGKLSALMPALPAPAAPAPPSTPLPEDAEQEEVSPAWDPLSRTPETIPRWLVDPRLQGIRIRVTEWGSNAYKHLEVMSISQDMVTVRDGMHTRTLPLDRVDPITPTRKEDPVVSFAEGPHFGKLFKIKTFGLLECDARLFGSKSGKGEVLHKLLTATLAEVYPPLKG